MTAKEDAVAGNELFPERFVPGQMHGLIEAEHVARYSWAGAYVAGRAVLDAGCGVGYGSVLLSEAGAKHVTGLDISAQAVQESTRRANGLAQFLVGDLASLPFEDDSFDAAVCFETIEHVEDQERALDELRRVLREPGLLLISSPNRGVYQEGNPFHTHEYAPQELRGALSKRFAHVRLERQQAWLTSLLCDERMLALDDPGQALELDARKVAGTAPDTETFTLALAGDAPLPDARAVALLTSPEELDTWRERARSAEEHLRRARAGGVEAAEAYSSISEAHEALRSEHENVSAAWMREQQEHAERERAWREEQERAAAAAAADLGQAREQAAELARERDELSAELERLRGSLAWRAGATLRGLFRRP